MSTLTTTAEEFQCSTVKVQNVSIERGDGLLHTTAVTKDFRVSTETREVLAYLLAGFKKFIESVDEFRGNLSD